MTANGVIVSPAKYSHENAMSLRSPRGTLPPEEEAECDELQRILRQMTIAERAMISPAIPLVSIHRRPTGQYGYRGHCIALSNDATHIAHSIPRRASELGIEIVVDNGGREKALKNPDVVRAYRVRAPLVRRALVLLLKHNKVFKELYAKDGIDEEAMSALPDDGIPEGLPILHEEREAVALQPADLAVTTTSFSRWLEAGEEDPEDFPIARVLQNALSHQYDLNDGIGSVAADI
jgi:hypothetical protein